MFSSLSLSLSGRQAVPDLDDSLAQLGGCAFLVIEPTAKCACAIAGFRRTDYNPSSYGNRSTDLVDLVHVSVQSSIVLMGCPFNHPLRQWGSAVLALRLTAPTYGAGREQV